MIRTSNRNIYLFSILYFAVIIVILVYHRTWPSVIQVIALIFVLALILGRAKTFVKDWVPLAILFLGYLYLRGVAPYFERTIYITPQIEAEKIIFGTLPVIKLQKMYFNPEKLAWYDFLAVFLYFSHLAAFLVAGFIFWIKDRRIYTFYIINLLVLSYLAFVFFLLFPTMPPWLAGYKGYIPEVKKIIFHVFDNLGSQWKLKFLYIKIRSNTVAAIPSLHASYPWLIFLFLLKYKFNRIATFIFLLYMILVFISTVYLGEHYFVDLIIGVLYASICFLIINRLKTKIS